MPYKIFGSNCGWQLVWFPSAAVEYARSWNAGKKKDLCYFIDLRTSEQLFQISEYLCLFH